MRRAGLRLKISFSGHYAHHSVWHWSPSSALPPSRVFALLALSPRHARSKRQRHELCPSGMQARFCDCTGVSTATDGARAAPLPAVCYAHAVAAYW